MLAAASETQARQQENRAMLAGLQPKVGADARLHQLQRALCWALRHVSLWAFCMMKLLALPVCSRCSHARLQCQKPDL